MTTTHYLNQASSKMKVISSLMFLALWITNIYNADAQHLKNLPSYDREAIKYKGDWLIAIPQTKTKTYSKPNGQIVLSNGLISRVFDISKGGATVGLENLMTGENMLRAIKPEAEVSIDGLNFQVGGLVGQPVQNYLLDKWAQQMEADPSALNLLDYGVGNTEPRFDWKKRPEWMPKDLDWPAPGKQLVFTYEFSQKLITNLVNQSNTDQGRKVLFMDDFKDLKETWEVFASKADERNSFINEGKAGEIMALANQYVYASMPVKATSKVWIVEIDPGTDKSGSWGPGMALQSKNGALYKFNLRTGDLSFGVYDGKNEKRIGKLLAGKKVFLRAEQLPDGLTFSYSYTGKDFNHLAKIPTDKSPITALRIGKMDQKAGAGDFITSGERGRSHINQVMILGELRENAKEDKLNRFKYLKDLQVKIFYELYDGIPLLSKWIEVINNSGQKIVVDRFKSEILALVEAESAVDDKEIWKKPNLSVETDFRFGGMSPDNLYSSSIAWNSDPAYKTQVNYNMKTPTLLEAYPKLGPMKTLAPGESMKSFRTWELFHDSWDRERIGMAEKRMYRSQAPWATENPIMMHVRNADNASVKKAIDQCAEVGFEMVIMTFGSGFEIENDSPENLGRMKKLADYAHEKGIALGGYSLLASRSIDKENDVVMPEGKKPRFGNSPCLESEWGQEYFKKLYAFYEKTGQDILEHDGSYPGDVCTSHNHPGHSGLDDSQWNQYETIREFYEWCRSKGIFLNVPDHYFMAGSNKTGMGYRETNWSLPRAQQEIIERQNIYDGTWQKTPSMGWMFVPLVEYHGGGKEATIEPLKDHLPHYEQRLANLFGAGVQACYRGPQLYDSPQTKAIVKKWVDFYKEHREVLDSDIVHIRRPDGKDYDGLLHVNPEGKDKGLIMLYNPLEVPVVKTIKVNLYYTGLSEQAILTNQNGEKLSISLNRDYSISLPINIPAKSQQWFVIN
ncbi:hypothetical protein CA2015_2171 [Cyclobacterium amurskyense]|uniref:Alpha-galactosidase n=2 Tax=Cyclobacterium amurskyense TaxID=320787 RepID=A0A0H4PTE1_9BACT|nr:hypothetical protein CA2015_2171 [Cyclobacterium amurskyense]